MPLRAAIIRNGRVKNVILLADDWENPSDPKNRFVPSGNDYIVVSDEAQMYDYYDGKKFTRGEQP